MCQNNKCEHNDVFSCYLVALNKIDGKKAANNNDDVKDKLVAIYACT